MTLRRIPPLVYLIVSMVASTVLAQRDPWRADARMTVWIGAVLVAGGVATALAGVRAFRQHQTTVDPRFPDRASALVHDGVYAWTRNPMYAGFVAVGFGLAVALASPLALVGPGLLWLYLDQVQIRSEEAALTARFPREFAGYRRTVRRWFGRHRTPPPARL
jgi:protein-S-isoprenylcysteine O-methyltransferase Ste14